MGSEFEEASFFAVYGLRKIGVVAAKKRLDSVIFPPATVAIEGQSVEDLQLSSFDFIKKER